MDEQPSKSQKKREADAMQKLGVQLVALSIDALKKMPLTEPLLQAVISAKSIKSHGALRRQGQLIGKLMRSADYETILAAYQDLTAEGNAQTATFHEMELWRERLINDGKEALTAFVEAYPETDVQQLRQYIKKAVVDSQNEQPKGASKALFRFLRSCL